MGDVGYLLPFEEQDEVLSIWGIKQSNGRILCWTNGFNILFSDMSNPQTREDQGLLPQTRRSELVVIVHTSLRL